MLRPRMPSAVDHHRGLALLFLCLLVVVAVAGCQVIGGPQVLPSFQGLKIGPASAIAPAAQATPLAQAATQSYSAKLQFTPARAEVGQTVSVSGSGYPAGAEVELVWYTVQGRYELQGGTEFVGQRYDERSQVVTKVRADQSGAISTRLEVPLDFGGAHDVRGRVAGKEISQASLTINPTFTMSATEGPVGTLIELKIVGVDSRTNVNTWHVLYDNSYLGFMSAVTTKGVAVARIRAAGTVGVHRISIWHNSFNPIPYLNFQQGPYKDTPVKEFSFQLTPGQLAAGPTVEDFSATDNPAPAKADGAGKLSLTRDRGPVGQATTLRGSGLPATATLKLAWTTMVGNRVSAIGFSEETRDLGAVKTGADGTFTFDMTIPDDLGGQHKVEVLSGDQVLAATGMVIEPSVVSISPTVVRAGDKVTVHLKGVGWTTYDNTYAVTYDNSYVGYVCGFSTNGDVQFTITATGAAGTHILDLYPTIYKGSDPMPRVYSVPQLTYAQDHPQRITPAIRLSIEISD